MPLHDTVTHCARCSSFVELTSKYTLPSTFSTAFDTWYVSRGFAGALGGLRGWVAMAWLPGEPVGYRAWVTVTSVNANATALALENVTMGRIVLGIWLCRQPV